MSLYYTHNNPLEKVYHQVDRVARAKEDFPYPERYLLIYGSRGHKITQSMDEFWPEVFHHIDTPKIFVGEKPIIISGGADGSDTYARMLAEHWDYPCIVFPALWNIHGKAAGWKRNFEMATLDPAYSVGFWDGASRGTASMTALLKAHKLKHTVINIPKTEPTITPRKPVVGL